jgi:hypothetical protein
MLRDVKMNILPIYGVVDLGGNVLQMSSWDTENAQLIGDISSESHTDDFSILQGVEVTAIEDAWVSIGVSVTAQENQGKFCPAGYSCTIWVEAGERVSAYGGRVNITPLR